MYIFQMSKVLMTIDSSPTAFLPDGKAPKTLLKSLIKPHQASAGSLSLPIEGRKEDKSSLLATSPHW